MEAAMKKSTKYLLIRKWMLRGNKWLSSKSFTDPQCSPKRCVLNSSESSSHHSSLLLHKKSNPHCFSLRDRIKSVGYETTEKAELS